MCRKSKKSKEWLGQLNRASGLRISWIVVPLLMMLVATPAIAQIIEFGWSGTISAIDPTFAAALPPNSGVSVGAPAFVRFEFESTTPDQDPTGTTGDYVGAITSFSLQSGNFFFVQSINPTSNSIIVFTDPLFGFYEPQTSVDSSEPLSGFTDLRGDVLFVPVTPLQLPDDSLLLAPPDPVLWSTALAGILHPIGSVLLDVQLDAVCSGACQPPLPAPTVPSIDGVNVMVLGALLVVAAIGALARQREPL